MKLTDLTRNQYETFRSLVKRIDIDANYPGKHRTIIWTHYGANIRFGVCQQGNHTAKHITISSYLAGSYEVICTLKLSPRPLHISPGIEPCYEISPDDGYNMILDAFL